MNIDITSELQFKTARSGGSGGQNVNKVETMVMALWQPLQTTILNDEQKQLVEIKLRHLISKEGFIQTKSQVHRSQLANKDEAIEKMNALINKALEKKKLRIAVKVPKAVIEKRIENKKRNSEKKQLRKQPIKY